MKIGDRVRHIYRGYNISCEIGAIVDIIERWDNSLENTGIYNPPQILVKLDEEFVTAGNDGFMTVPSDYLIEDK